jgi:hypothetical protein
MDGRVSIPATDTGRILFAAVSRPGARPVSYLMGTVGLFSRGRGGVVDGVKLTTHSI